LKFVWGVSFGFNRLSEIIAVNVGVQRVPKYLALLGRGLVRKKSGQFKKYNRLLVIFVKKLKWGIIP
jgi:hypothetical protein